MFAVVERTNNERVSQVSEFCLVPVDFIFAPVRNMWSPLLVFYALNISTIRDCVFFPRYR